MEDEVVTLLCSKPKKAWKVFETIAGEFFYV